jgi:hypothetical protein
MKTLNELRKERDEVSAVLLTKVNNKTMDELKETECCANWINLNNSITTIQRMG